MELGGNNNVTAPGSNSSNEDLSQYTDADESISAPTEILAEFLSALMGKDYPTALKFCKIILQYEPDHETAKQFYPLIQEKLFQGNMKYELVSQISECNSEDDSTDNNNENDNIQEWDSDNISFGTDQTDSEETTANYSSLEDEVADLMNDNNSSNNHSPDISQQMQIQSQSEVHGFLDDNGNSVPSISTTSDSDSFQESKNISTKLKSILINQKHHKYIKSMPSEYHQ